MVDDNKVRDVVEAVKGVFDAVPVYEDAIQPAARQVGRALETLGKVVNVALAPVTALVWGYEQIESFVQSRVAEKLRNVPPERIRTPNLLVAGPTLEALRFAGHEESLRDLYANLLATSLDAATARDAHPSFVAIIRDMSPDEARIMRLFSPGVVLPLLDLLATQKGGTEFQIVARNFSKIGREADCKYPELTPSYLDNLCRLGLLDIPTGVFIEPGDQYQMLENDPELKAAKRSISNTPGFTVRFTKKLVELTNFGKQFCAACVQEHLSS